MSEAKTKTGGPARRISLFKSVISEEAVAAVGDVLRSGWLGLGPKTAEFEKAFATYVESSHCVGMNSATSALHVAVRLLNLPEGSEVITTPVTFVSTNHAILYERCKPVFADVDPLTGNLTPETIRRKITDKTRAIMLVHLGGYPCDLDEIYALARERNLAVIEDCAHAAGASYKGKKIGSHGDLCTFSFHAVKNMPMGDGGALVTKNKAYDERARRLRWLGIDADTFSRTAHHTAYKWEYTVDEVGFKYHMNDIQAAIGLVQLGLLDKENARRRALAQKYREGLKGVPGIEIPPHKTDRVSSYHLITVLAERRNDLSTKLKESGIDTGVHYRRNDEYAMYPKQDLPGVDHYTKRTVSLPNHLGLTDDDVAFVIETIRKGW